MNLKALFPVLLSAFLLAGCSAAKDYRNQILVSFAPDENYTVYIQQADGSYQEQYSTIISSGQDLRIYLRTESPYVLSALNCNDYEVEGEGQKQYISIHNLTVPTYIQIETAPEEESCQLTFSANGGVGDAVTKIVSTSHHKRPNTLSAQAGFEKDSATLLGWNTAPDGSGIAVGLGSRVTVPQSKELTLYAQWSEWTPIEHFALQEQDGAWYIVGYQGEDTVISLPKQYEGKPITAVGAGAFSNTVAETVILPETIQAVEDGAFVNCQLKELYLFDNLEQISDAAFSDCPQLKTVHINAVNPPAYASSAKESCYADKVDRLILNTGKNLVFYSGCSMLYNLDSEKVQQAFPEYTVANMGLNGRMNSIVQMEILAQYLSAGDIFVHAPEECNEKQLLGDISLVSDSRILQGLELNYDLLTAVDVRHVENFFDGLQDYLTKKSRAGTGSYTDYYDSSDAANAYGDVDFLRKDGISRAYADTCTIDPAYLTDTAVQRLRDIYRLFTQKGVQVYLSYSAINGSALAIHSDTEDAVQAYEARFTDALQGDSCRVISHLDDMIYDGQYFYESNFHLTTNGVALFTQQMIQDVTTALQEDAQ